MKLKDLSIDEAIGYHLHLREQYDEDTVVFSSLTAVLEDTRLVSGRDLQKGVILDANKAASWLGAAGYLTVLDQLGKAYKPKSPLRSATAKNSITKALSNFTILSDEEKDALYALRCAIVHDYSLFNVDTRNGKHNYTHHFAVTGVGYEQNGIVKLPRERWDCNQAHKSIHNTTVINLPMFGQLVEGIYESVVEHHSRGELMIDLPGGHQELVSRYLMFIHTKKK